AKLHESKVIDHAGVKGLVSIISIKWTTARLVAERVVDVLAKRHSEAGRCKTRTAILPDSTTCQHDTANLDNDGLRAFVEMHIAHTQARHLDDIVLRRTNDLVLAKITRSQLRTIVAVMAAHFGWTDKERNEEVRTTLSRLAPSSYRQTLAAAFSGVNL
ncbi:MAG: glycerol-3-phosphate dehydrogenase C-terminal domain-containing protein, partial [Pseudomonadota bacterium]